QAQHQPPLRRAGARRRQGGAHGRSGRRPCPAWPHARPHRHRRGRRSRRLTGPLLPLARSRSAELLLAGRRSHAATSETCEMLAWTGCDAGQEETRVADQEETRVATLETGATSVVEAVRELLPEISRRSRDFEDARMIPPDIIERLAAAGAFRMFVPKR